MQAVGAKHQHVAGQQRERGGVRRDEHLFPHRANQNVPGVGLGRFLRGDQPHLPLLVNPGMVLRDLPGRAVADQVAARVAHMRNDRLIVAQGAGNQRGGHLPALVLRLQRAIVNGGVGLLNQARHQSCKHCGGRSFGKFFDESFDDRGRGNLAVVHAAHAIGDGEEITVASSLAARGGNERAHRVLVVGANLSEIGCLAELNVEHGRRCLKRSPG